MSTNGRGGRVQKRSARDKRLQALSERRTAVGKQREELVDQVDSINVDPQEDVVERRVDGEVRVELTDSAEKRRLATEIPQNAPIDRLDPSEIRITDDGYELSAGAQRRLDEGRIEQLQSALPNEESIYVPPEGEGFEARNVVTAIGYALQTPDDLNDARAVADAAGVGVRDLQNPVSIIDDLDPEAAAEALPFVDDPESIRTAQQQIRQRRKLIEENPSEFASPIFRSDEGVQGFVTIATSGQSGYDRRIARIRGAYRQVNEKEDEIAQQIASDNELLKASDIDIGVDQGNFEPTVNIDREQVEQRQREQLRIQAAEDAGVDESLINIEETEDALQASIDQEAQIDQFRQETAEDFGVDLSAVDVEISGDELLAEVRRDRVRRQQQESIGQPVIDFPGDDDDDLIETNEFGKVSAPAGIDDPLAPDEETKLDRQVEAIQPQLDAASERLSPLLKETGSSVGSGLATLSVVPAIEEATVGTNRLERAYEGAGEEAFMALDVPGALSSGIGAIDFAVQGPDRGTRSEVVQETATVAATEFADAATERPVETTGRAVGALAGGFGVGAAASRGARGLSSARRAVDMDFDDFRGSSRAQADLTGRSRREVEIEDTDALSPIPDDAGEQRLISSENPRMTASEVGERRIIDEQIEAGRQQIAPDDRPQPDTTQDPEIRSVSRDRDVQSVSREPDTGPNSAVAERAGGRGLDTDLSPLESQLAAQQRRRSPDVDMREIDRSARVPDQDARETFDADSAAGLPSVDEVGAVGAAANTVDSDVGVVTGSPTLTGDESPTTSQTLLEVGGVGVASTTAGQAAGVEAETRTATGAQTDLRANTQPELGFGGRFDVSPFEATGVGIDGQTEVGIDERVQTASDLATQVGIQIEATGRSINSGQSTTPQSTPTPNSTIPSLTQASRLLTVPIAQRATRSQRRPRSPRAPETASPDSNNNLSLFGGGQDPIDSESRDRSPAVGWASEQYTAFALGGFGERTLPEQTEEPAGFGLEAPTAALVDPESGDREAIEAVGDLFGFGNLDDSDDGNGGDGFGGFWL